MFAFYARDRFPTNKSWPAGYQEEEVEVVIQQVFAS